LPGIFFFFFFFFFFCRIKVTCNLPLIATPVTPTIIEGPPSCATPTIAPGSVCSTTSDQDPTLLPTTMTSVLRTTETRKRRGSVAIWSDPNLVALANRNIKAAPEESKLKHEATHIAKQSTTGFSGDGRLVSFNEEILGLIVNHMDFMSILQLSAVSKKCRDFVLQSDKILRTVDLSHLNKHVTDTAVQSIVALVGTRARKLILTQCFYITDEGFKALVEYMPNVESMDLNSCWLLTDKSLVALAVSCPQLTKLDLSNCRKISDIGIFKLLDEKASRGYPQLTDLSLSYCKKLTDMTMSHLAEFCSQSLNSLNIQRCTRITDQGFVKWADTQFVSLKTLNLTDCSFLTDQAVSHLVAAAPNLRSLSLSFCCALSDSAIEGLISLPELQDLDVSFCGAAVSDISIKALLNPSTTQSNFHKCTMNSLNLRGCVRITDICVKAILELSRLDTLNISQCPGISLDAKKTLRASGNVQHLVA
jgi:F-box/leucine-rich repeat protein 7